jgi:hypothetical protein
MRILQQKNMVSLEELGIPFVTTVHTRSRTRYIPDSPDSDFSADDRFLISEPKQDSSRTHTKKYGPAANLPPELGKTLLSMAYLFVVTWITAFVMVIVHDRVPDMKKYPPLPDIFLDNVPTIPWAFHMCEVTGSLLLLIWVAVLLTHKHR